jgi:hypothetical protein
MSTDPFVSFLAAPKEILLSGSGYHFLEELELALKLACSSEGKR